MRPGRVFEILGALSGLTTGIVLMIFARDIPDASRARRAHAGGHAARKRGQATSWALRGIGAVLVLGAVFVVLLAITS